MNVLVFILLTLLLITVTLAPAIVIWRTLFEWLPEWYGLNSRIPVTVSTIFSILLVLTLGVELEGGSLSLFPLLVTTNMLVSIALVPIVVSIKYLGRHD